MAKGRSSCRDPQQTHMNVNVGAVETVPWHLELKILARNSGQEDPQVGLKNIREDEEEEIILD